MRWIVFLVGWLAAGTATADRLSAQVSANGSLAATDNTFSVDDNKQSDVFFQVRPGLVLAYNGPRMLQELDAEVEAQQSISHGDRPSVSARGTWQALYLVTPLTELSTSASAAAGQLTSLQQSLSPEQTQIVVARPGRSSYEQVDARESLTWTPSRDWRVVQSAFARYVGSDNIQNVACGELAMDPQMTPRICTRTTEVGAALRVERSYQTHAFAVETGVSELWLEQITPMPLGTTRQLLPRVSALWRHDLDARWTTSVDAGVVYLKRLGAGDSFYDGRPLPVAGVQLSYVDVRGSAAFAARRTVTAAEFLATTTVNESVTTTFALPLRFLDDNPGQPRVAALGSAGVERTRVIDDSAFSTSFLIFRADAAVAWTPKPAQSFALRGEYLRQASNEVGMQAVQGFTRLTVLFTFATRFPDNSRPRIPKGPSVRADRSDQPQLGAQPVVPDDN